ncbi:hypothetical protein OROHE_007117 [Orobanche hederae]
MSKKGKQREEDEALSEGDEPPRKITKTDNNSDDSDQIVICELSKNRKVSVRNWQGKVVVDIREFYVKDGKELPGKRVLTEYFEPKLIHFFGCISLTMDQWEILREHVNEIDQEIAGNT